MNFTLDIFDSNGECKIRSVYTEDKGWIFSVYDFINLACGRDIKDKYSSHFIENSQYHEVSGDCFLFQFQGERQRKTLVTNIPKSYQFVLNVEYQIYYFLL
jgi:hypothetical protein